MVEHDGIQINNIYIYTHLKGRYSYKGCIQVNFYNRWIIIYKYVRRHVQVLTITRQLDKFRITFAYRC